eukprot:COSAG02_NODE_6276_length_3686_cov_2.296627_4_plen_90_part_00
MRTRTMCMRCGAATEKLMDPVIQLKWSLCNPLGSAQGVCACLSVPSAVTVWQQVGEHYLFAFMMSEPEPYLHMSRLSSAEGKQQGTLIH